MCVVVVLDGAEVATTRTHNHKDNERRSRTVATVQAQVDRACSHLVVVVEVAVVLRVEVCRRRVCKVEVDAMRR